MTSQSRRKHQITAPSISSRTRRLARFRSLQLAGYVSALCLLSPLTAEAQPPIQNSSQTSAPPATWTNRSAKVWASAAHDQPVQTATHRGNSLPWRRVPRIATKEPAKTPLDAEPDLGHPRVDVPTGFDGMADWQSSPEQDAEHARRMAQVHLQHASHRGDRSSGSGLQPPQRFSTPGVAAANSSPFDDPGQHAPPAVAERPSAFDDPFGDSATPVTGKPHSEPALFQIATTNDAHQSYAVQMPRSNGLDQPLLQLASAQLQPPQQVLRMHQPSTAFQTPKKLAIQAPIGLPQPSLSPAIQNEAGQDLDDVPEFPEYKSGPETPPTPQDVPGNEPPETDPSDLPDLEEPPRLRSSDLDDNLLEPPRPNLEDSDDLSPPDDSLDEDSDSDPDDKGDEAQEDDEEEEDDEQDTGCDRIYNDRDCCERDEVCRSAWERLNQIDLVDAANVNISPPLVPLPEDEEDEQERREQLAKAPSRDWRNRSGTIVATGKFEDLVNRRVIIRTQDGGTKSIPFYELGYDESCFVTAWWGIPHECQIQPDKLAARDWAMTTFTWKASAVCHKTPFFEDVQLERYGHSAGPVLQPVLSGAHFFANLALLPYNAGVYPATECHYVLGYYRPGNCAPWLVPAFPLSRRGAAAEALGLLGFFGLF